MADRRPSLAALGGNTSSLYSNHFSSGVSTEAGLPGLPFQHANTTVSESLHVHLPLNPLQQNPPTPSECEFEEPILSRPATVLTTVSSIGYFAHPPVPLDPEDRPSRPYEHTINEDIDYRTSSSRSPSPKRSIRNASRLSLHARAKSIANSLPTLSGLSGLQQDYSNVPRSSSPTKANKLFGDLFVGESEPAAFSLVPSPTKERPAFHSRRPTLDENPSTTRPTSALHSMRRQSTAPAPSAPPNGKFSWLSTSRLGSYMSPPSHTSPSSNSSSTCDEILSLNPEAALFPHGALNPLDPTSFNTLLSNATATITKLQSAYKAQAQALADLRREKSALADEADEAETRARHLRVQLDDMAAQSAERAAEQDERIRVLVAEVARERMRGEQERERRERSVRMVPSPGLSKEERERKRRSGESDSGFESQSETDVESVWSRDQRELSTAVHSARPMSPSTTVSSLSEVARSPPDELSHVQVAQMARVGKATVTSSPSSRLGNQQPGVCVNCQDAGEGSAWGMVSQLRGQNRRLAERVGELEASVEGCLDLVAGLR